MGGGTRSRISTSRPANSRNPSYPNNPFHHSRNSDLHWFSFDSISKSAKKNKQPPPSLSKIKNKSSNQSGSKIFRRVPILPAPFTLPLSQSPTSETPGSTPSDVQVEMRLPAKIIKPVDGSRTNNRGRSSSHEGGGATRIVFPQQPRDAVVSDWLVEGEIETITKRQGLISLKRLGEADESLVGVVKVQESAKQSEPSRTRKDSEGGRTERREPTQAYSSPVSFPTRARVNTAASSNQSRSELVSTNPISTTATTSSSATTLVAGRSTNVAKGRNTPPGITTIPAQSVPVPTDFTFDGYRHHHKVLLLHKELLQSPTERQQGSSGGRRQKQHQRHHHHYHYKEASSRHLAPSTTSSTVLPFTSSTNDDGDEVDEDEDGDFRDEPGITNFAGTAFHQAGKKVANMKAGSRNNNSNTRVQALHSTKPTHYYSSLGNSNNNDSDIRHDDSRARRKKHRHLSFPFHLSFSTTKFTNAPLSSFTR